MRRGCCREAGHRNGSVGEPRKRRRVTSQGAGVAHLLQEATPLALELGSARRVAERRKQACAIIDQTDQKCLAAAARRRAEGLAALALAPPRDAGMVEGVDGDVLTIELFLVRRIEKVGEAAVMIKVVVRDDHRVEVDTIYAVVFEELPVDEVGGVLSARLRAPRMPAVDHDMPEVGRPDEHAVALADVDEVDLEQRVAAEVARVHPTDALAPASADRQPPVLRRPGHLDAITPEQVSDRVVAGRLPPHPGLIDLKRSRQMD